MRKCSKCGEEKPLDRFAWRKKGHSYRRECKDCSNKLARARPGYRKWHKNNKQYLQQYMADYDLQRKYGLSLGEYEKMLQNQNGHCAICGTTEFSGKGKKPHVDHCHKTGKIRALLCNQCNVGLGAFRDSPELMEAAINYIKKHGDTK